MCACKPHISCPIHKGHDEKRFAKIANKVISGEHSIDVLILAIFLNEGLRITRPGINNS